MSNYSFPDVDYVIWELPLIMGMKLGKAIAFRNGKTVDFGLKSEIEAQAHAEHQLNKEYAEKNKQKNKRLCLLLN